MRTRLRQQVDIAGPGLGGHQSLLPELPGIGVKGKADRYAGMVKLAA